MKKNYLIVFLLLITSSAWAQVQLENPKNWTYIQGKTLAILTNKDNPESANRLKEVFKDNWTLTPVEVFKEEDFDKLKETGKYIFWKTSSYSVGGAPSNKSGGGFSESFSYYYFYGFKNGSSGKVPFATVYYFNDTYANLQCYLKSLQKAITEQYKTEKDNYVKYKSALKKLKTDTLYVPSRFFDDTVTVTMDYKRNLNSMGLGNNVKIYSSTKSVTGDRLEKRREKYTEMFKAYNFPYKFVNSKEIDALVKKADKSKPFYMVIPGMIYGYSQAGVYTYVYNANTGEIVYMGDKRMMYPQELNEDDVEDLLKSINKAI